MIKAFLEFSDQDAVLLRSHSMPIEGKANIGKNLTAINDTLFTLTWKPLHITISESADLAYTYGTFSSVVNDTLRTEGTYLTIWKKQDDLSWKWILDTGNEGLD
jgi:ketosteroid isomerase-like protein